MGVHANVDSDFKLLRMHLKSLNLSENVDAKREYNSASMDISEGTHINTYIDTD